MKKNYDEMLEQVKQLVGERDDDEALAFIEDCTDSFSGVSSTENDEWQKKYEENDKMWREKYRSRFFEGDNTEGKMNDKKNADEIKIEDVEWRGCND